MSINSISFNLELTGSPVHHVRGPFIRTEEENFRLLIEINERFLDAGSLSGKKKIDDRLQE
jgi:hypothetical protein